MMEKQTANNEQRAMKAYNLKATKTKVGDKEVSVISLGENGRGRVNKLIRCESGVENGELVTVKIPKPGMPGAVTVTKGGDPDNKWLMRISTEGSYIRGAEGNVRFLGDAQLIAKGYGAFGDAGRTGTWDDVLICVSIGTVLRVKPSRGNAYFLLVGEDSIQKYSQEEANFEGIQTDKDSFTRV